MIAAERSEPPLRPDLAFEVLRERRARLVELTVRAAALWNQLEIGSAAEALEHLKERVEADRFRVMVLGEFKRGKSTFVNALLGQDVLPAKVVPCTAVITEIKWAPESRAVVHFRYPLPAQLPKKLPREVTSRLEQANGGKIAPIEIPISRLREFVEISAPGKDQAQSVAETPYEKVEIYWPLDLCRNDIEIIDSPGLNEHETRARITLDYLRQADAVLFVLSCSALGGLVELSFVDQELLSSGHESIFFICNRWDDVMPSEQEEVRQLAAALLAGRTGFGETGIYFLSAREALAGRVQRDSQRVNVSGILPLERALTRFLAEDRSKIKILQPAKELDKTLLELQRRVIPSQLEMSEQSLENLLAKVEEVRPLLEDAERRKKQILLDLENKRRALSLQIRAETEEFLRAKAPLLGEWAENTQTKPLIVFTAHPVEQVKALVRETAEQVQERLRHELSDWAKVQLEPLFRDWLGQLEVDLGRGLDGFFARIQEIQATLVNLKVPEGVEQTTDKKRLIAGGIGFAFNPALGFQGLGGGFNRYMAASLGTHIGTYALLAVVLGVGPILAFFSAAFISSLVAKVGMPRFAKEVKKRVGMKLAEQLQTNTPSIGNDIAAEIEQQTQAAVKQATTLLDGEIRGIREQVQVAIHDKQAGEAKVEARKRLLGQVSAEAASIESDLREIIFSVAGA